MDRLIHDGRAPKDARGGAWGATARALGGWLALAAVASPARSADTVGAWAAEDLPVPYRVVGDCPESLGPGTCEAASEAAFAAFSGVSCSHLTYELRPADDPLFEEFGPSVTITFGADFHDGVVAAGAISVAGELEPGVSRIVSGNYFLGDDLTYTTDARIATGECGAGEVNLDDLMFHVAGYLSGFDTPMGAPCQVSTGMTEALADEVRARYGPRFLVTCNPPAGEPVGVPFTVWCTVASPSGDLSALTAAHWVFSDGGTAEGLSVEHTFPSTRGCTP